MRREIQRAINIRDTFKHNANDFQFKIWRNKVVKMNQLTEISIKEV